MKVHNLTNIFRIRSFKCFFGTKSSTLAWSLVSGLFNPVTKLLCGRGSQFRSPLSANATDDAIAAESVLEAIPIRRAGTLLLVQLKLL